eukprot:gene5418-9231_t
MDELKEIGKTMNSIHTNLGSYDFLIEKSPLPSAQVDLDSLFGELTNENGDNFEDFDFVQDSSSGSDSTPPHQPTLFQEIPSFGFDNSTNLDFMDSKQEFIQPEQHLFSLDTQNIKEEKSLFNGNCEEKNTKSKRKREEREKELDILSNKPEKFKSTEEEQEWKKQKRMIRNRLSAQASREKKRGQLQEFEKINFTLKQEIVHLKDENEKLKKENETLRTRLNVYEPLNSNQKTMVVFIFLFTVGLFFKFGSFSIISNSNQQTTFVPSLQNRGGRVLQGVGGRVLQGVGRRNILKKPIVIPQLPSTKNVYNEMSHENFYFKPEVSEFLLNNVLKNESVTNEMKEENETTKEIFASNFENNLKYQSGVIFHTKDDKDGLYFMCPIMYPLSKEKASIKGNNETITFFIPVEKRNEKNQTVMKLSKVSASIVSQTDAFISISNSL